jgi:hypothetical protein
MPRTQTQADRRHHRGGVGPPTLTPPRGPRPYVTAGKATCCRCDLRINPGDPWHLHHNEARDEYIGVSHKTCNVRAAAAVTSKKHWPVDKNGEWPTDGRNAGAKTHPQAVVGGDPAKSA